MLNRNAKRVTIYSDKGGCGKSTLTANLARGYSILNQKTLIIDMDFQSDQLIHFKLKKDEGKKKTESYYIPEQLANDIITYAKALNRSKSEVITKILAMYINNIKKENPEIFEEEK